MLQRWIIICLLFCSQQLLAGELDDKTIVLPAWQKTWQTFSLSEVRLLPGSPFYKAMTVSQQYLLNMDVDRMLNRQRKNVGIATPASFPGTNQPEGTRSGDLPHYLSGISLMYAQTGDERFLSRVNYIITALKEIDDKQLADTSRQRRKPNYEKLLDGHIELSSTDEAGYPWGGFMGNDWYGIHKLMAAYRDAYLYANNKLALALLIRFAEPMVVFALKANPDMFDNMLDIEHGGMNEVFADLYALTGDKRYMDVSIKFNHQKVILNIADGKDVLNGRHANMQVPTFVGTARQWQLNGDEVSKNATLNFLQMVYHSHMSCIGGNSCYERFGRPGETTRRLGYTGNETCNTYNMLKTALNVFESNGDLQHMEYFERALYNHILASQDPESGGVTYYTSLQPGGIKSFSNVYDLKGVWCCVGTGMENHSKYGEAIYFHNNKDVYVNLFIPSTLNWKAKGLELEIQTKFPEEDIVTIKVKQTGDYKSPLYIRQPEWATKGVRAWINGRQLPLELQQNGYIRLAANWKAGDEIKLEMPQTFHLEVATDDANAVAIMRGPLVMSGALGKAGMPADLIQTSFDNKDWVPPVHDIPTIIANTTDIDSWMQPVAGEALHYTTNKAGFINGKQKDIELMPYYQMRHQRYNVYWKLYATDEWNYRKKIVSDEVNPADKKSELSHAFKGEKTDTSLIRDDRHFWENNHPGRYATNGGWFSYDLKVNKNASRQYLVVTYWGSSSKNHVFDVLANDVLLKHESIGDIHPLTYYDEVYELDKKIWKDKDTITIRFQSERGTKAGLVFGARITSDVNVFKNYSFY